MRFRLRTCVTVMGAVAMLAVLGTFGADSATSQPGVIDSRLRASGSSASAPLVEARSGHAASPDETLVIDTATSIGTLIMFR